MKKQKGFIPPTEGFRRNNNKCAGFTFLELIVSMLVLTMCIMITLGMFAHGSLALKKSSQLSIAGLLAQSVMERTIYQTLEQIEANSVTGDYINFPTDKKWVNKRWKDFKYKVETISGTGELANFKKIKITVQTPLGSEIALVGLKQASALSPVGKGIFYMTKVQYVYQGATHEKMVLCYIDPEDTNNRGIIDLIEDPADAQTKRIVVFRISPDRKKIIYTIQEQLYLPARTIYHLCLATKQGNNLITQDLTTSDDDINRKIEGSITGGPPVIFLRWSPSSDKFSISLGINEIAVIGLNGNVFHKISKNPGDTGEAKHQWKHSWSPDGKKISYIETNDASSERYIKTYALEGEEAGTSTAIKTYPSVTSYHYQPIADQYLGGTCTTTHYYKDNVYSPEGDKMAFFEYCIHNFAPDNQPWRNYKNYSLFCKIIDINSGNELSTTTFFDGTEKLSCYPAEFYNIADWSNDGSMIIGHWGPPCRGGYIAPAFWSWSIGENVDGEWVFNDTTHPLSFKPILNPVFSPDGSQIAWRYHEGYPQKLHISSSDGTGWYEVPNQYFAPYTADIQLQWIE